MSWLWSSGTSAPISNHDSQKKPPPQTQPDNHDKVVERDDTQLFLSKISAESTSKEPGEIIHDMLAKDAHGDSESIREYLLPTTMSCREAFDSAFYCTSLGGAFTHLYRYGTLRSCGEHWNKFWFCMRTRTYGDEAKEESIKEYYRNIERTKYGKRGTSSEDIWESRASRVEKGTAFKDKGEEWKGTDEEWREAVLQMRMRMREKDKQRKIVESHAE